MRCRESCGKVEVGRDGVHLIKSFGIKSSSFTYLLIDTDM